MTFYTLKSTVLATTAAAVITLGALANPALATEVEFTTSAGKFRVELNDKKAPKTVANFLQYVDQGFYNGLVFHRVIKNFMIQAGGFDQQLKPKMPTAPAITNEADNGLKNRLGSIAMARTSDPHSATAQFFINAKDNSFLDHRSKSSQGWGYTVFGNVTSGISVVKKIESSATQRRNGMKDVPVQLPTIIDVKRVK